MLLLKSAYKRIDIFLNVIPLVTSGRRNFYAILVHSFNELLQFKWITPCFIFWAYIYRIERLILVPLKKLLSWGRIYERNLQSVPMQHHSAHVQRKNIEYLINENGYRFFLCLLKYLPCRPFPTDSDTKRHGQRQVHPTTECPKAVRPSLDEYKNFVHESFSPKLFTIPSIRYITVGLVLPLLSPFPRSPSILWPRQ